MLEANMVPDTFPRSTRTRPRLAELKIVKMSQDVQARPRTAKRGRERGNHKSKDLTLASPWLRRSAGRRGFSFDRRKRCRIRFLCVRKELSDRIEECIQQDSQGGNDRLKTRPDAPLSGPELLQSTVRRSEPGTDPHGDGGHFIDLESRG